MPENGATFRHSLSEFVVISLIDPITHHPSPNPNARARSAASWRVRTPSLASTRVMWLLTVAMSTSNRSAMARLLALAASSSSTSTSRGENNAGLRHEQPAGDVADAQQAQHVRRCGATPTLLGGQAQDGDHGRAFLDDQAGGLGLAACFQQRHQDVQGRVGCALAIQRVDQQQAGLHQQAGARRRSLDFAGLAQVLLGQVVAAFGQG